MKTKRLLAALLTILTLVGTFPCVAFAADNSDENPEITSHTIVLTVPAADSNDDGIAPCIWGQDVPSVGAYATVNTASFDIPDRYFAFEATASGGSGQYTVNLKNGSSTIATATYNIDGVTHKEDWITINSSGTHYFRIINSANCAIKVTITYYSWK